jgi:hypothetical protein
MRLSFSADSPHMNMEDRSTLPTNLGEPVAAGPMADVRKQPPESRQELWKRAHRLYAIGELNAAAKLFTHLAEGTYANHGERATEAAHG